MSKTSALLVRLGLNVYLVGADNAQSRAQRTRWGMLVMISHLCFCLAMFAASALGKEILRGVGIEDRGFC